MLNVRLILECTDPPGRPGRLGAPVLKEEVTIVALKYDIALPATLSADHVAKREVTSTVNNDPPQVQLLDADAAQVSVLAQDGDQVSVVLVDIDKHDNRSTPSPTLQFLAKDTIPPHQPGGLNVLNVTEVDDPVPPTVPPAPPPAPAP